MILDYATHAFEKGHCMHNVLPYVGHMYVTLEKHNTETISGTTNTQKHTVSVASMKHNTLVKEIAENNGLATDLNHVHQDKRLCCDRSVPM